MIGFVEDEATWNLLDQIDMRAKQGNDSRCVKWIHWYLSDCHTTFTPGYKGLGISCIVMDSEPDPKLDFKNGQFDFFVNGITKDNEILFQVWADSEINLDQEIIDKINFISAALNCTIAIASLLILMIVICCRRCESFAVYNLLLIFLVSGLEATVEILIWNQVMAKFNS